jgi:hypothetical protein
VNVRHKLAAVVLLLLVSGLAACLPAVARAAEPPTLALTADPATVVAGEPVTLAASLPGVSGATLTVTRQRAGATGFTTIGSGVTDAAGKASWTVTPPASTTYRVEFAGDATHAASLSEVSVGVRPRVTLTVVAPKPLFEKQDVRYTVTVRPAAPGETVQLVRWAAGGWVAFKDLTLDGESQASARLAAGAPGRLAVRAQTASAVEHLAAHSLPWKSTVYDRRNPYGVPTSIPRLILVDLSQYKLYYHEHGNVVRVFDCVLGRPSLPTPPGHYKIYAKDPHMGGPYGPFRMRYLGLYAIHGTNEPWLLDRFPRNYSHGCTRLANANITWLYSRVHVGTPVWNVP